MIKTFGLAHVALKVADVDRSFRFYRRLLGARLLGNLEGRDDEDLSGHDAIEFGTPGSNDVIVLMRSDEPVTGDTGQLEHMAAQEQDHLDAFDKLLASGRVRPTAMSPIGCGR